MLIKQSCWKRRSGIWNANVDASFLTEETKGQRKGPEAEQDDDENVWTQRKPGVWGVDSQWDQFTMASSLYGQQ